MKKYIETIHDITREVVKRLDVSNESDRSIDRIVRGFNINLNHNEYSVEVNESDVELEIIK